MNDKKITINQNTISYYDTSSGITTLLFIHGSFINKDYWKDQLDFFSRNYRVIALDLTGHGTSTHNGSDWTIQAYGKEVSEFVQKLALKNVILIGHSVGADIMVEAENNDRKDIIGLVGIDYFKNVGVPVPQKVVQQTMAGLKTDFAKTSAAYAKQVLLTPQTNAEITQRVITNFETMNPKIGLPLDESLFGNTQRQVALLQKLPLKLCLINVTYSPTNEAQLKKYVGHNYELHTIQGTCHFPMIENPALFNTMLQDIIQKITAK